MCRTQGTEGARERESRVEMEEEQDKKHGVLYIFFSHEISKGIYLYLYQKTIRSGTLDVNT